MAQEFEQVDQTELPYSLEAEQTILGSIFVDASVLSECSDGRAYF